VLLGGAKFLVFFNTLQCCC